jgi:hemerythrin-like metal-binding protein
MSIVPAKFLEWTREYTVHDAAIDHEHQILYDMVDRYHEAMLGGQGKKVVGKFLTELTKFTLNHFSNEEKLMAATNYPKIKEHILQHDRIRRMSTEVQERIKHGETAITIELLQFLSNWLKNHTMVTDRQMGDYVQVEQIYAAYLERLLQGDKRGCGRIVQRLLTEGISFENLYVDLLQKAMYHTGDLWMKNRISVATEHLITATTLSMMTLVHPLLLDAPRNGKKAVVTCVGGELHQVGGKMVSDMFELHGWDSYFLGADTPVEGLLDLIGEKQPDVLCLSVSLSIHVNQLEETVEKTRARFSELNILVGGQAFLHNTEEFNSDPRLSYLRSLYDLDAWIASR